MSFHDCAYGVTTEKSTDTEIVTKQAGFSSFRVAMRHAAREGGIGTVVTRRSVTVARLDENGWRALHGANGTERQIIEGLS